MDLGPDLPSEPLENTEMSEAPVAPFEVPSQAESTPTFEVDYELELEAMDAELAAQASQIEELTEALRTARLESYAEIQNIRRRAERTALSAQGVGEMNAIRKFLPVADSAIKMRDHIAAIPGLDPAVAQGVAAITKLVEATLRGLGVEPISATGKPFDPTLHESVGLTDASADIATDHVADVLMEGYVRVVPGPDGPVQELVRPATVIVAQ